MKRIEDIQALRCGDKVIYQRNDYVGGGIRLDGRYDATVIAVSHDNTDNCPKPFSQITVRVHDLQYDRMLSGPEAYYSLWAP